jgi:divalent metal cation (Fe/Co/Zn/Cd) transporter
MQELVEQRERFAVVACRSTELVINPRMLELPACSNSTHLEYDMEESREKLYQVAVLLAYITIFYNLIEGAVSVWFGVNDETFALFGFGLDSFIEVISGVGIWHMVRQQRATGYVAPDRFERRALRITGGAFYTLAVGLTATALLNIHQQHRPSTTLWGIIIALVSIVSMWFLIRAKVKVGTALNSPAILADAACTKACLYLSLILLVASVGYALTGIGYFDSLGALGIAGFSLKEGSEAFRKARGVSCDCARKCGESD